MMEQQKKIRWGILGLGNIARQFVYDLKLIPDAELVAVACRDLERSKQFAEEFGATQAYGSYLELIESDGIDIVYVATSHDTHAELSIGALGSGKAVLCEKPVALNATETREMIKASKEKGSFLMEAFWTRFNPSFREVYRMAKQGEIGELKYVNAEFAFRVENPKPRYLDLANGGGSLLEIGVYPLFLAYTMLGVPERILAVSNFYDSGSDRQTSIVFQYPGAQALLHSSFDSPSGMSATICGTEGRLVMDPVWHETQSFRLIKNDHEVPFHRPTLGKGFSHEIMECHDCLKRGLTESPNWSHKNSLELIKLADAVRCEIGMPFPSEKNHT